MSGKWCKRWQQGYLHSVPVHDLVHGDGRGLAVLPPAEVVLGNDAPRSVVHLINIVVHSIGVSHVVCCCLVRAWNVSDVVRLAEIIPGENLDNVWSKG